MIASLAGTVQMVAEDHAVVDVGGVGYLVQASSRTLSTLSCGERSFLLVETQVREAAITLFAFASEAERALFRLLSTVQGVGGRVALALLSTLTVEDLVRAITLEDRSMIARAPGVGPRLAARIATELKGKALPGPGISLATGALPAPTSAAAEAISALENLGFRSPEAARAVAQAQDELGTDVATATLIREALKRATR
jgi:Holliday junction DNA helicase RuvA